MGDLAKHDFTGQHFNGQSARRHGNVTHATLLSLQLLLLAFFALLTALSSFEGDRSRLVIDSLQSAFASPLAEPAARTAVERSEFLVLQRLQEAVGDLVRTEIPLTRVARTEPGRAMRLDLPAEAFFGAGEARLNPMQRSLFERLVAALDHRPAAYRYEIDVLQPDGLPPELLLARADALAEAMTMAGVPASSLSVGSRHGEIDRIEIMIHLRERDGAATLFDALVGGP
ncbi:hypothetical protein [Rhodospirillaceae bacterium SYSU D60014]|uniref:hypothetical protein n=1 Tax=Virgifigura deserti TaxID=2268457 RepID=UPI000E66EC6E